MKPILRQHNLLALLAASCVGMAAAADLPVSRTTATVTVSVPAGGFTMLAVPLQVVVASGTVSSVSGTTVNLTVSPALGTLTGPHAIMITNRVNQSETGAYGKIVGIASNTASAVVTDVAITPSAGDSFVIVTVPTLNDIVSGDATARGFTTGDEAPDADKFYVEDNGSIVGYWWQTGVGFKSISDTDGSGATLTPSLKAGNGCLVSRLPGGSPVNLSFTGVNVSCKLAPITNDNFNVVNNPFLLSTTLRDSGISAHVAGGSEAPDADYIYIENAGSFSGYYFNTDLQVWSSINDGGSPADAGSTIIPVGKALLYFKRPSAGGNFGIVEPFTE